MRRQNGPAPLACRVLPPRANETSLVFRKLVAALCLLAVAFVSPVRAVTDFGHPAISRMWQDNGDRPDHFLCTGWYLAPVTVNKSWRWGGGWQPDWSDSDRGISWIVSAGHCAAAYTIHRNPWDMIRGMIDWVSIMDIGYNTTHNTVDLAVGKVPDTRDAKDRAYLELAPQDARAGDSVFIHGFPKGVERIVTGRVVSTKSPEYPGAVYIKVVGNDAGVWGGMSGSPVLDAYGRVVGVLWGITFQDDPSRLDEPDPFAPPLFRFAGPEDVKFAIMTPVSKLKDVLRLVGVHGFHE